MSTIHLRIYDLRKANRMSQKELADEVGVSVQTVSKWENNVCMPDITMLPEIDGIYIDGLEYSELCSRMGFRKMWVKEKECQGRDYAIGMRMPLMMRKEGLIQVDVRMNDRVTFAHPEREDYAESIECFMEEKNWRHSISPEAEEEAVRGFINHGMNRKEAESYCRRQRKVQTFVTANQDDLQYLHYRGLVISYGWKKHGNRF